MSYRDISRPDGGFTLVEMMIALAVFSFGLLGVIGIFVTSIQGNAQGKRMTEATSLAQSRLDYLLTGVDYEDLDEDEELDEPSLFPDESTGGPYARYTNITAFLPGTKVKQIEVTVEWSAHKYGAQSEGGTSIYTKRVKLKTIRAKDR